MAGISNNSGGAGDWSFLEHHQVQGQDQGQDQDWQDQDIIEKLSRSENETVVKYVNANNIVRKWNPLFKIQVVKGDGDCFFTSVGLHCELEGSALRKKMVKWVLERIEVNEKFRDSMLDHITSCYEDKDLNEISVQAWVDYYNGDNITQRGVHGDFEIRAVCSILNVNITFFTINPNHRENYSGFDSNEDNNNDLLKNIYVFYWEGFHFDGVIIEHNADDIKHDSLTIDNSTTTDAATATATNNKSTVLSTNKMNENVKTFDLKDQKPKQVLVDAVHLSSNDEIVYSDDDTDDDTGSYDIGSDDTFSDDDEDTGSAPSKFDRNSTGTATASTTTVGAADQGQREVS